jgi:hypothetical protein
MNMDVPAVVTEALHGLAYKFANCMLCFSDLEMCQEKHCELLPFRHSFLEFFQSTLPDSKTAPCEESGSVDVASVASYCVPYPLKNEDRMLSDHCESASSLLEHVQKNPIRIH